MLCGWSDESLAKVQEDVVNVTATPAGKAARRLLVEGKANRGAAPAQGSPAQGSSAPTDPDALAKVLCAELDVAKKLDAVGTSQRKNNRANTQASCVSMVTVLGEQVMQSALICCFSCDNR